MPDTRHGRPQAPAATVVHAKFDQGLALHQQGKLADAARIYSEVLQQQPNHFDALHLLGVIAAQTKKTELAVELITKAIRLNANVAAAHSNLGIALLQLKRPGDALTSYDKAIALKPDFAEAHYNRGIALRDLKRPGDALASYDTAIALKSDDAEAHYNRGNALRDLKRSEDALASYDKAIALRPDHADAFNNRGAALLDLKRPEEALASCDKAIGIEPRHADAHNNRGNALRELQRPEEALASHDMAIALKPDFAQAHYNRGIALTALRRSEDALASYDKAIALKPDYADAHWNQSLGFLLMGRFEQGWRQFEWRKRLDAPLGLRSYAQPLWLGTEDIAGKTLFIYWEQGLGDTIQFCRYAKLAQARGAKVVLSVQQPLVALLKELSLTIRIIGPGEVPADFDYHCPLLSLPLALATTLSNIPAAIPYLKSNGEKSPVWKEQLGEKNKPRVGLVWSGGFRPKQTEAWNFNSRRDIPLAKLAVLKDPNIAFYSLQKGEPAESELAALMRDRWDGPDIIDFTSRLHDFSDTAALMENLDLIISVDTSTAHLAGALGKPVWILNRFDTCWRWLLQRADSPWYPTVKLYRQEKAGCWDDVVERIRIDLSRFHPGEG
ncbi:MAG TPA: tetratricopeptide repeat-containing glycosyltransferase family protein [Steroidobacteraceae bacterium]|nr:tetratricopeptide repeat-containing glycosyltransferase family protein [Steroidobacteraceae bacterium]